MQAPKLPHQLATREEGVEPETEQRERPKANVRSESETKATVNTHEAAVSEETRQAQDEEEQAGQQKQPPPEPDGGNSSKSKGLGDQVNRHPGACLGEKPPDEAVDREAPPSTSTSGRHHSNQAEISQHCDTRLPSRDLGSREKKTIQFSMPGVAKSEDSHHRRNGKLA